MIYLFLIKYIMNYYLDQQMPPGMICKTNALNMDESSHLVRMLNLYKFGTQSPPVLEYGYVYKNGEMTVGNNIPDCIYTLGEAIKKRLSVNMKKINSCTITECVNEQYIKQRVDSIKYGDHTLFMIVGMPVKFTMINLKNSRAQFTHFLHSGTCVFLQSDSRFTWTYNTVPSMGKRWIITLRHVSSKYKPQTDSTIREPVKVKNK